MRLIDIMNEIIYKMFYIIDRKPIIVINKSKMKYLYTYFQVLHCFLCLIWKV